eukprot:9003345-Heterocapsa_arctica.AAC.1
MCIRVRPGPEAHEWHPRPDPASQAAGWSVTLTTTTSTSGSGFSTKFKTLPPNPSVLYGR